MIYLIGIGHDVDEEDMVPFVPQPRTRGMQYDSREYSADLDIVDELPYVDFMWNVIGQNYRDIYWDLLGLAGLQTANTAEVSVKLEDNRYQPVLKNGIAQLPQIGEDGDRREYMLRDFVITVHSLRNQA